MSDSIWIGFDPRQCDAFAVCRQSIIRRSNLPYPVHGVVLSALQEAGLYTRPIELHDGRYYDPISDAPMSTQFAISRFLTPILARKLGLTGWALFMDCDMLVRADLGTMFRNLSKSKAVYCVKHVHIPSEAVKMDGQQQVLYARKNWSSVMVFNLSHPANAVLDVDMVNTLPGRDLHRFCWLEDELIGELGCEWNYLVGYTKTLIDPKVVHFTKGLPSMAGHQDDAFADEWRRELAAWAVA